MSKHWLDVKDKHGNRRLNDPDDLVRIEIATAMERNIQVIPVLFDNISMPSAEDLPDNLRSLPRRQFVEIQTTRFEADVKKLADAIKELMPPEQPGQRTQNTTGATGGQQSNQHTGQQHFHRPQNEHVPRDQGNMNAPGKKPDNYLVLAIVSTVLCCLPLGIVSIIHSTKVDNLWNSGQYAEANRASNQAKQFAIFSAVAAAIVWILYFGLIAAGLESSY